MSLRRVESLRPMGLDEVLRDAALVDRVDAKYIVGRATADELLDRLIDSHGVLEIAGVREFRYRTIYYDTPDLLTLREHRAGRRRRFKVRQREYLDTGHRALEVKLKGPRGRTLKHAIPFDGDLRLDAGAIEWVRRVVADAYERAVPVPLEPALTVLCRRSTLVCPERGERLTIDTGLDYGGSQLLPGYAIVESKSAAGRSVADRTLRELGARPAARCSKYCLGMTLGHGEMRVNDVLPLLRRYFGRPEALADVA